MDLIVLQGDVVFVNCVPFLNTNFLRPCPNLPLMRWDEMSYGTKRGRREGIEGRREGEVFERKITWAAINFFKSPMVSSSLPGEQSRGQEGRGGRERGRSGSTFHTNFFAQAIVANDFNHPTLPLLFLWILSTHHQWRWGRPVWCPCLLMMSKAREERESGAREIRELEVIGDKYSEVWWGWWLDELRSLFLVRYHELEAILVSLSYSLSWASFSMVKGNPPNIATVRVRVPTQRFQSCGPSALMKSI